MNFSAKTFPLLLLSLLPLSAMAQSGQAQLQTERQVQAVQKDPCGATIWAETGRFNGILRSLLASKGYHIYSDAESDKASYNITMGRSVGELTGRAVNINVYYTDNNELNYGRLNAYGTSSNNPFVNLTNRAVSDFVAHSPQVCPVQN